MGIRLDVGTSFEGRKNKDITCPMDRDLSCHSAPCPSRKERPRSDKKMRIWYGSINTVHKSLDSIKGGPRRSRLIIRFGTIHFYFVHRLRYSAKKTRNVSPRLKA